MDFALSPLHNELCKYLRKKLYKTKIVLEYHKTASIERATNSQEGAEAAFRELEVVVRRADDLLLKCMCKQSSWLDATVTLPNIKEEVLDIVLDLFFWKVMLKIATTPSDKGWLALLQYAAKALEKHEELHEKLLKADSPLQTAADRDRAHLLDKLSEVKERHASSREGSTASIHEREYILSIYLLAYLKEDDKIATEVESQLRDLEWGKYLCRGGFGQVNEATWLQQPCAVKVIQNDDPKEVQISRGCNHPNIVQFFWFWEQERTTHIIMERMPEDLSRHIKRLVERNGGRPFQLHVAIDIMLQIAKAMRYLHNKKPEKIVHRDLKTSNILVRPLTDHSQGYVHVKLADFGISKFYNMSVTSSPMSLNKGTTVYAAPEIFNHQSKYGSDSSKLPPKIDVWSFSMVCSEILTGTEPFPGEPKTNLHAKIEAMDDFRPPLPSDCPEDLRTCITKCWECDPRKRPTFIQICKMLKIAKAQSLGIIHFNSSKRSASFNHPTVNNPTSRLLTSEPQAASSGGDSNVEMTGGPKENREVEQIISMVARCSMSLSGPLSDSEVVESVEGKRCEHGNSDNESSISLFVADVSSDSVMARPVVFEAVDTDHVAASPDQAVKGDVSNLLGHGAPNSSPTSEPQAKGVDLPKAGLTVAASATIPPQGTTPRNPTSSQPMMMMWNEEEERRPPDSRNPTSSQPMLMMWDEEEERRPPDSRIPTSSQPMMMMWNEEEERRPPDSSRVSRPQVPLLPQHYHLCGEQGHQVREPHYFPSLMDQGMLGQFPESSMPHTPEPAPAVSPQNEAKATSNQLVDLDSFPEMRVGLQQSRMVTTATVQLTATTKGTTGVTKEGIQYPAPVPIALPPHSVTQHSTRTDMRQMSWSPYGGLLTSGMTNSSPEVQPSRANSAGASDVEKKGGLEMVTTETVQLTIPRKGTTGVTQEGVRYPAPVPVALPHHRSTQHSTGTDMRPTTWPQLATSGRTNLSSEMQLQGAGSAGASNVEKKAGLENGPKEGHQFREPPYLRSLTFEWPQSSTTPTAEPAPAVSSQYEAKATSNQLIDLDFLTEMGLPQPRMAATAAFQPTSPMKGTTGVNQEGIRYPAAGSVALPTHSGTQHSTGPDTSAMTWPVYEGSGTSGRTNLSSEVQPRGAGSADASNVEKKGGQENWPFEFTQHAHMGQTTRSPYGGLPTSGRTNLLSEVQPQPPRADFASGSNVEKKGGLVDEGQRQQQNPSKYNPPLHSGLSGADSNLVAAMGQNITPNPTFKPPQAQIALQQDKPMPQYAELMAKAEERKKSTVYEKELNQLQHDSKESEKRNKRRKADSPP